MNRSRLKPLPTVQLANAQAPGQTAEVGAIHAQLTRRIGPLALMTRQALFDQLALKSVHRHAQLHAFRHRLAGRQHGLDGCARLTARQIHILHIQAENARSLAMARQRLDRRTTNQMLQLTHVAWPVMAQQRLLRLGTQPQAAQPQPRAVFFEKVAGQQQHIATTLAQRGTGSG